MRNPTGAGNMTGVVFGPIAGIENDELFGDLGLRKFRRFDKQIRLRILVGHHVAPG